MTFELEISPKKLKIQPANEAEEILQNVLMILLTQKYTVPLDRELGIDTALLDQPLPQVQARLTAQIASALATFEPRAQLQKLSFDGDAAQGKLIPKITVEVIA